MSEMMKFREKKNLKSNMIREAPHRGLERNANKSEWKNRTKSGSAEGKQR